MAAERFPIEASHIMMFARAIGDDNPVYYDHENAVAPPTFMQASAQFDPDYFLRPKIGQPWFGSGKEPTTKATSAPGTGDGKSSAGGILHAEQRFEYHRHPRAGDVLTATTRQGERWEKQGKRSGKLVFSETITDYHNQDGTLMVTAISVGVTTERAVDQ